MIGKAISGAASAILSLMLATQDDTQTHHHPSHTPVPTARFALANTSASFPAVPPAEYTASRLSQLWDGITVQTAAVTVVAEPTPISELELIPPPNLPRFDSDLRLPSDFVWGMAATAPQIEGAADADGKGPSVWDTVAHRVKGFIKDGATLDTTANHYYLYKQDIDRIAALKIPHYSLSVAWSRVFPLGRGEVNEKGLQHYVDEIQYMVSKNVTPIVTIYHWDIPQALQDEYGGWLSEKVVDDFVEYARVVMKALAPLGVKYWITLNEPQIFCEQYRSWPTAGVQENVFPVHGITDPLTRLYLCGHNSLLAHAKASKVFREEIKPTFGGKIGFANSYDYTPPLTDGELDRAASERSLAFTAGWINQPVFIDGDYPRIMKDTLGNRLPSFSEEQKQLVLGSSDFYAWDSYTGYPVTATYEFEQCIVNPKDEGWPVCADPVFELPGGFLVGNMAHVSWLYDTPDMFRQGVLWSWETFKPAEYFIPEFGFAPWREHAMAKRRMKTDEQRVAYYEGYLHAILELVNTDFVNLKGAIGWSVMDNLEWRDGFETRFGMQSVDYATQERQYKKSFYYFKEFFETHIE